MTTHTLTDAPIALADYTGQVVVLDFFSMWCDPCVDGLPEQVALAKRWNADGLVVLLVAQDDDAPELAAFLEAQEVQLPVAWDEDKVWFDAFSLTFVPSIIVIDREGRVAGRFTDIEADTHHAIDGLVADLLAE